MSSDNLDAAEIVSSVATIYSYHNANHKIVKPRSLLPCSWFAARECFMIAYEREYIKLSEEEQNSYHHVYRQLSFFVADEVFECFEKSLDVATSCYMDRQRSLGLPGDNEVLCKDMITGQGILGEDRDEIWTRLGKEAPTCPAHDRLCLAETLAYCGAMHKVMWDEWVAFHNLVAYRNRR